MKAKKAKKSKKAKRRKKPKPVFVVIEGYCLNEKTGIMEQVKYRVKVFSCKD